MNNSEDKYQADINIKRYQAQHPGVDRRMLTLGLHNTFISTVYILFSNAKGFIYRLFSITLGMLKISFFVACASI